MTSQRKAMKLEIVPQPKQVEQPTRNWLDLPSELTANILYRVGAIDILQSAQKVCTAWREICKDPAMWRVVYMDPSSEPNTNLPLDEMCMHAVDRSRGQLLDITIVDFGYNAILEYIADRSSQLKRLTIACCDEYMYESWRESLKKFPLLEELNVYETYISKEGIETASRYCPMLKTLKVNQEDFSFWDEEYSACKVNSRGVIINKPGFIDDETAMAIGQNLHELRHLELIRNTMSNEGLEMILDGCHHLESLDLRGCFFIDLHGDLGKRCLQQIKCVKLPKDSLEGCPFISKNDDVTCDVDDESEEGSFWESDIESDDESEGGSDDESDERCSCCLSCKTQKS